MLTTRHLALRCAAMAGRRRDLAQILYEDFVWSIRRVARHMGRSYSWTRRHLVECGTRMRPTGVVPGQYLRTDIDHDEVVRLRIEVGLSAHATAAQVGCHHSTVTRIVRVRAREMSH